MNYNYNYHYISRKCNKTTSCKNTGKKMNIKYKNKHITVLFGYKIEKKKVETCVLLCD